MTNKLIKLDLSKISGATEPQLGRMLKKYNDLVQEQDKSILNIESHLELSKNKRASLKGVIQGINIAMMQFNTVSLYSPEGKLVKIDVENYDLYIADGYIDPDKNKVLIFKKGKIKSSLIDTLDIDKYQLIYGNVLHPLNELKEVAKNTFAIIVTY